MNYYNMDTREVIHKLNTSSNYGLSDEEGNKRLQKYGKNTLDEGKRTSLIIRFLNQFKDFMVIVLIVAAVISAVIEVLSGGENFADSIIIIIIVLFNGVMGVFQEAKADRAIDALKSLTKPYTTVIRNSVKKEIPSDEITVGDIILIESGNKVPADCRVIEAVALKTDESALTGESLSVDKSNKALKGEIPLAERENMIFMGTSIVQGRGKAVVTAVGKNTEMGHIASMLNEAEDRETPLQKKLGDLGRLLGIGAILICILIFSIGVFRKIPATEMFMESVSLAVAAIPEGLPAVVTIMLAIGVSKMAAKNAVIKSLPAVEALGNGTVICSDKTGTLTENKMKVVDIWGDKDVLKYGCLCCDADSERGEPTELAIVQGAELQGYIKEDIENNMPRVYEIPFTSERKMMTTFHIKDKGYVAITKGACENVLRLCSNVDKKEVMDRYKEFAKNGLRVLAVAIRYDSKLIKKENNMNFLGLIALEDSPREGVEKSIELCKKADIRTIMITGDSPLTAQAIGNKIGISGNVVTGSELDEMSDTEFGNTVDNVNIYARVSPSHKLKIVDYLQSKGEIVAMTGDGINDAPALKKADVGCAMGNCGTEVAREASDIVLSDDNFNTIVAAIEQGRIIFENIKKAIHFLLSSNIGEIITIFSAVVMGFPPPLLPVQLLWVNLVTDSFPAVALGLDSCDEDIMIGRKKSGAFLNRDNAIRIALEGAMIGILALLAFAIGNRIFNNINVARTMSFSVLSISQLVHSFNMRSEKSLLCIDILGNIYIVAAFVLGVLLQIAVVATPLGVFFGTEVLTGGQWLIVMLLSIVPIFIVEIEKRAY